MKKISEQQMNPSSRSVNELEVCIAVSLEMSDKLAAEQFNDWPYIYLDSKGNPIFDLAKEPPFMPSDKAQKVIDGISLDALANKIAEHYNGLDIKADAVFKTTELC